MSLHRISRRLLPGDRVETPYLELPFELNGTERSLEVVLRYDTQSAVIDLGCVGAAGWRGWSGGAKSRFVITETEASGGYCPGAPEAGRWAVVLGLHKVPAEGVLVEVEINTPATGPVEPEPAAPPANSGPRPGRLRNLPASPGLRWYAGDFHAHTVHSDGSLSIRQLAARAADVGLDFLAVTDHNTVSHHRHLPAASAEYGVSLLPGQEVTTARGHANAYGAIPWVDFRQHPQTWVDSVAGNGGLLSINHPVDGDCSWQWNLERKPAHAEIMHSTWQHDPAATSIWSWWNAWGTAGVTPLGGSDFHRLNDGVELGTPTTWVAAADPSPEGILEATMAGRTALSMGSPNGGAVLLRVDDELIALDAEGAIFSDVEGRRRIISGAREIITAPGPGPYRLEAADRRILAISA
ncbi:MAG TPA: CehA/McbA family metallohydrolase [Arthrobacter sp.]|nr:CehA/McbA family metallohydrolase [Arthrobacter sp.]